ncbi:DegT/DnrJ/EryC1/StrS family aminotransferase [Thermosediminibacter litoriperuensis]|uniref:dTDP-4-amino-4,6-dideoxygalactose transaminase n=1 Tax=Thermosediminibacter litoriperuensis TaxID=291989 RepID=A0A5S5APE6_9FIRM|nr:DegT/DnrJ/EryC1/StrS aminotransferase family protein [Thermosediminibacter litoriperuensis]TYP52406.1 dTDP-4-amino-4,6-dideoxygalactose transaminase [Thermosediminibacter litoriperuensis]
MRNTFLPFSPPVIGEEEIDEVVDTLKSSWITTGPKTRKFEEEFKTYIGAKEALALNSCTAALHVALVTQGIGSGDEVITTPLTFTATVNVIEHVGAKPVLVDVEEETLNIDPEKIEKAITPKTKAIMAVHYSGHPAEMDKINEIANKYNLHVIEDAAHALPAKYKGRYIGSGDNLTAFSFYATKNLTTAEGGMLTGPDDLIEKARIISLHGMSRDAWKRYSKEGSWYYEVVLPGFKYNMTDIQASLGLHQLNKLAVFQKRRYEIVEKYNSAFKDIDCLEIPSAKKEVEHAWHLYVFRLRLEMLKIDRNRFIEELKNRNIGTSVHFIPIHIHPYYKNKYGFKENDFPVAYNNYLRMISLPLNPGLSDQDVADVIEAVLDVIRLYKK